MNSLQLSRNRTCRPPTSLRATAYRLENHDETGWRRKRYGGSGGRPQPEPAARRYVLGNDAGVDRVRLPGRGTGRLPVGDSFFSLKTFSKSDDNGIAGVYSRYEETGSRDRLGGPVDQQNGDAIEHGVDASATGANQRLRAKVQGLQAAGGGQQVKRLLQRQVA